MGEGELTCVSSCSQTGPEIKASQPVEMGSKHPDPWSSGGEGVKGCPPGQGPGQGQTAQSLSSLLSTCSVSEGAQDAGSVWREGRAGKGTKDTGVRTHTLNHEQPDELL